MTLSWKTNCKMQTYFFDSGGTGLPPADNVPCIYAHMLMYSVSQKKSPPP